MNFIDHAYVINLDKRQDRLANISAELYGYDIDFERWPATEHENGIIGLLESMKGLLRDAISKRYLNVMVLEDDAHFLASPKPFLESVFPQLPGDYHLFYLGLNLISRPTRLSENILKVNSAYSTHSIVYSRAGMELTLAELEKGETIPFDILLMHRLQTLQKCYCTYPMLCTQTLSYSDIEKSHDRDWGKLMRVTYAMHTKNI